MRSTSFRILLGAALCVAATVLPGSPAGATTSTSLLVPQATAFSVLGRSCGGIQEQAFATGFDPVTGNPVGDVYLQTRCGGSGRGGGYHTTTYSAWVSVTWNLGGTVLAYTKLAAAPGGLDPAFTATDTRGDQVFNTLSAINVLPENCAVGNTSYCTYRAYLDAVAPGEPTGVNAFRFGHQLLVWWTPDPATAAIVTSSTVTATPVSSTAPVLVTTTTGAVKYALVGPLQPATTYSITVAGADAAGSGAASAPIMVTTP